MPIPVLVCRCPDDDASMSPRPNRDLTTGPISRNLLLFSRRHDRQLGLR